MEDIIGKFKTGDIPTGDNFAELIRACFNVEYKNVTTQIPFPIPANAKVVTFEADIPFSRAKFDLYSGYFYEPHQFSVSYSDGQVTINFNATSVSDRNGVLHVHTIEKDL